MITVIRLGPRRDIDTALDSMGRTWVGYDPERTDVELWAQNRGRYAFAERRLDDVTLAALAHRGEIKVVAAVTGWERFADLERGVMKRALIGEVLGPGDPVYDALRGRVLSMAGQNPVAYFDDDELGLGDVHPGQATPARSRVMQGWQADPVRRKVVEDLAQERLMAHYRDRGWDVVDTRVGNPYDAVARKDGEVLYLEAKGTETRGQAVLVTRGEVEHARAHPGQCVLGVLSEIRFSPTGQPDEHSGVFRLVPWHPDTGELVVVGYEWRLPKE